MVLRRVTAALVALGSIPLCAAVAAGAVYSADCLLGETVPSSCGKRGLLVGLMGIWGTVLFGFLLGQADWIADQIADPAHPEPSNPAAGTRFESRLGANASRVTSTTNSSSTSRTTNTPAAA